MQEWIPDAVWLNVVALASVDALRDLPDAVMREEGGWRAWYDQEAPERAPMPEYEGRLSKFERMCVVKVRALKPYTQTHKVKPWYDQEAPELAPMPEYEGRLSKFERMCVVKVRPWNPKPKFKTLNPMVSIHRVSPCSDQYHVVQSLEN